MRVDDGRDRTRVPREPLREEEVLRRAVDLGREPLLLIVLDKTDGVIRHQASGRIAGLDEQDDGSIWS